MLSGVGAGPCPTVSCHTMSESLDDYETVAPARGPRGLCKHNTWKILDTTNMALVYLNGIFARTQG